MNIFRSYHFSFLNPSLNEPPPILHDHFVALEVPIVIQLGLGECLGRECGRVDVNLDVYSLV